MPLDGRPAMQVHGRLAHITDMHANPRGKSFIPEGRTDTYHEDCLFEWEAFREDCRRHGVMAVAFSGDFFNLKDSGHYRPRDLHFYSELVASFGIPWFFIPGNHDLPQASMDNYGVSALRALAKMTPNMHNVMDRVVEIPMGPPETPFSVFISGSPYAKLAETFECSLPELEARLAPCPGYRVALVHTDLLPPGSKPLPGHWNAASYDDVLDALPSAHLVCAGHIHNGSVIYLRPHPQQPGVEQRVSKPFAAGRTVKDYFATTEDVELQHVPTYTLIEFRSLVDADGRIASPIQVHTTEQTIDHIPFDRAFKRDSLRRVLEKEADIAEFLEKLRSDMEQRVEMNRAGMQLLDPRVVYAQMDLPAEVRALIDLYLPPPE